MGFSKRRIMKVNNNDPDMMEEYDFSKGVRGKYAERYAEGTRNWPMTDHRRSPSVIKN